MTLRQLAEQTAVNIHLDSYGCRCGLRPGLCQTHTDISKEIERVAKQFAERALRGIYSVDDNDQTSSDGHRARGSFRVKSEFEGRPNVEWRYYRKDFEKMVAEAIAAAEND